MSAKIYQRKNGTYGAIINNIQDTGHYVSYGLEGFTVFSIEIPDLIIAKNATIEQAEFAIEKDWYGDNFPMSDFNPY